MQAGVYGLNNLARSAVVGGPFEMWKRAIEG